MLRARIQSDQLEQKIQSYSLSLILSLHTELQFFTPPHKSIGLHESNPAELHSKNNLVAPPSGHISPYQVVYKRVRCGETNLNSFTYVYSTSVYHFEVSTCQCPSNKTFIFVCFCKFNNSHLI